MNQVERYREAFRERPKPDRVGQYSSDMLGVMDLTDPDFQRDHVRVIMELKERNAENCAKRIWRKIKHVLKWKTAR